MADVKESAIAAPPAYDDFDDDPPLYDGPMPDTKPGYFPPTFNGYFQKKLTFTMHLGKNRASPLHAVSFHTGYRTPQVVIHTGTTSDDPHLVTGTVKSKWTGKGHISTFPGLGLSQEEEMHTDWSLKHVSYRFTIDVGVGKDTRKEEFEWRSTHGEEVRGLSQSKYVRGWKLVRNSGATSSRGGERAVRDTGVSSDGKEIVAVYAWNQSWSMTKAFKFQFLGSGLTGELGDMWELMAVVSAVRLWYQEYIGATSGAGAASGSAAAAVAAS